MSTITSTIITVASDAHAAFERNEREGGETFYTLAENAPEWLRDAVMEAHSDEFPNDHLYSLCLGAVADIADASEGAYCSDQSHDFADSVVPIYNAVLARWLADNVSRASWIDEAQSELGTEGDVFAMIAGGMYLEAQHVWNAVHEAISAEAERRDEEAEDAA